MTISPAVRLSIGLVMFTMSVVLFADLLGVLPKKEAIVLDARKKVCESLAVQLSVSASSADTNIMNQTLRSFVERNEDVLAASMSRVDGTVVANFGDFAKFGAVATGHESSSDYVIVPVYEGETHWGSVNVEFTDAFSGGLLSGLQGTLLGTLLFVMLACYIGYFLILRKTLKVLDPRAVIPDRVRSAFNTLSEGVLIIDKKDQILMANDAFARKVEKNHESLIGLEASSLNWKKQDDNKTEDLPWKMSLKEGVNLIGVGLNLSTHDNGVRSLSVNSAPILDDEGRSRGALVTFDDITEVQETNQQLEKAVDNLVEHQLEITKKNSELEILAARDPLTGCYNRRVFFDYFEHMFREAKAAGGDLSCIMVDIDHFKSVNDRFGHSVGDEVIRMVADILNSHLRDDAIVGRYGGEEFCIALPGVGMEKAAAIAERLRLNIQIASKNSHRQRLNVTASFGVSTFNAAADKCTDMLDEADKALYRAKKYGRNRVKIWKDQDDGNEAVASHRDAETEQAMSESGGNNVRLQLLQRKISQLEDALQKKSDAEANISYTDPITGLPTRIILEDRLRHAIAFCERANSMVVVVILNIDMLSRINLAMGEEIGNAFLMEVSSRLKAITRRSDTVASMIVPGHSSPSLSRLRADEFALIFSGIDEIEAVSYIIKRIQEKFKGKIIAGKKDFYVTSTVGVALYPNDGSEPVELIENARTAQKHAKQSSSRNEFQFYSNEINQQVVEQMQLEVELLNALETEQLRLVYQPKLDMRTGVTHSMEALVRWEHPEKGMIGPLTFIPLAEKCGIIIELGEWILNTACKQIKTWVDMGAKNIRCSVNVSAHEFSDSDFLRRVKHALKSNELSARHLEIEITESAVLKDLDSASKIIDELRYLGVTVSLDDFGTGYSSFSYLGKLDFNWIKLDRSFLLEALGNARSRTMYESIVAMAKNVGFQVVCEGIETTEQYNFSRNLKVDEIQGYILSPPINADSMSVLLFSDKGNVSSIAV